MFHRQIDMRTQHFEWIRTCPLAQFDPQHARRYTCARSLRLCHRHGKKEEGDVQMAGWCANTTQFTINTSLAVLSTPCSPTLAHASNTAAYLPRLSTAGFSSSSPTKAGFPDTADFVRDAVSASRSTSFRSCGRIVTASASTPVVALRTSANAACTARCTHTAPNATLGHVHTQISQHTAVAGHSDTYLRCRCLTSSDTSVGRARWVARRSHRASSASLSFW